MPAREVKLCQKLQRVHNWGCGRRSLSEMLKSFGRLEILLSS